MLFNKKPKFLVAEKQIKEELKDANETTVLKINLRYPQLQCGKNDPLNKNAVPLYSKMASELYNNAKTSLFTMACKAAELSDGEFSPYSVVMLWENTYEDKEYLSLRLDISVSMGETSKLCRKAQVWNRKNGTLCALTDFIPKDKLYAFAESKGMENPKRKISQTLFVLGENGLEIFVEEKEGYSSLFVPKEQINCEK